jgi:hypothetical protein
MMISNGEKLVKAYPSFLDRVEGGFIVWKDGTRLPLADGVEKDFETWLAKPGIQDMFRVPYLSGEAGTPPPLDSDPGRARNAAFFEKSTGAARTASQRI